MKKIERITLNTKFEIRDLWVGCYFDTTKGLFSNKVRTLDVYICLIPCFPLHIKVVFKLPVGFDVYD